MFPISSRLIAVTILMVILSVFAAINHGPLALLALLVGYVVVMNFAVND